MPSSDPSLILGCSTTQLAYIAGIVDGEGTITLNKRGRSWFPSLTVASTAFELLEWLKEVCGGHITSKRNYKSHHSPSGVWNVYYNRALYWIDLIYPFLIIKEKRRRADLLITRYKAVTARNGKYTEELWRKREEFVIEFFSNQFFTRSTTSIHEG